MKIRYNIECDINEFFDDSEARSLFFGLTGEEYGGKQDILMKYIAKISAKICSDYETSGGANRLIVNPIFKNYLEKIDSYYNDPIEHLSCRFIIKYDENIDYNLVYVMYQKDELNVGGIIELKNYSPFNIDEILDEISLNGINSLSKQKILFLNKKYE